ncbi:hypothetical protein GC163_00770 [bacterium]|nr:hypothetical protein [bacterium]
MSAKTLASVCALCLFASAGTASAQDLFNPFTWFSPTYSNSSCANGQCNVNSASRPYGSASCPNGNCGINPAYSRYPTANCPNGNCPLPSNGYTAYRPAYPTANYGSQPMNYSNQYYSAPRYSNDYRYTAPVNTTHVPSRAPSNYNYGHNYNGMNSPFYP